MVKLRENPRLERFLATLSLVVIALNFVICLITLRVRKDDIKQDIEKKEVAKKVVDSASKKQQITAGNKKEGFH